MCRTSGGGEQGCGPRCREVGRGSSSIGAKSQRRAGGEGSRVKSAGADDATDRAAHVVAHVGHVNQVADAATATVAAVVGRVERRGLRRRVGASGRSHGAPAAVVNTGVLRTERRGDVRFPRLCTGSNTLQIGDQVE